MEGGLKSQLKSKIKPSVFAIKWSQRKWGLNRSGSLQLISLLYELTTFCLTLKTCMLQPGFQTKQNDQGLLESAFQSHNPEEHLL